MFFDTYKQTVKSMSEAGATDEEIDAFTKSVNVTEGGRPVDIRTIYTTSNVAVDHMPLIKSMADEYTKAARAGGAQGKAFIPSDILDGNMRGRCNFFKNDQNGRAAAHRWGSWALAAITGNQKSLDFCQKAGIIVKGQTEGSNSGGGYLVPDLLLADIIDLRPEYGVFRKYAHVTEMHSDTVSRPRRVSGLTTYWVGEAAAITDSSKGWDNVTLVAKKIGVLGKISSELSEDAVINVGDDLAKEIVWAFSKTEDECGFNGDATSTYGGITGVIPRLSTLNGVDDGGGLVLASGNAWSEVTLADLTRLIGRCPGYARRNARWYCSPTFHDSVLLRLALAAGGVSLADVIRGSAPQFCGYEIVRTEVLPATEANSQIACLFGSLDMAADLGSRREIQIAFANSGSVGGVDVFASDQTAFRGTERFDIVVHDVGTASVAGPVVGLVTASS